MVFAKGWRQPTEGKCCRRAVQEDVKNFLFRANIRTNRMDLLEYLLSLTDRQIAAIGKKVINGQRLSADEGLTLYQSCDLGLLGALASFVKQKKSGNEVYFIRNFHIEPSNICIYKCCFCSYSCNIADSNSWEKSIDNIGNGVVFGFLRQGNPGPERRNCYQYQNNERD